ACGSLRRDSGPSTAVESSYTKVSELTAGLEQAVREHSRAGTPCSLRRRGGGRSTARPATLPALSAAGPSVAPGPVECIHGRPAPAPRSTRSPPGPAAPRPSGAGPPLGPDPPAPARIPQSAGALRRPGGRCRRRSHRTVPPASRAPAGAGGGGAVGGSGSLGGAERDPGPRDPALARAPGAGDRLPSPAADPLRGRDRAGDAGEAGAVGADRLVARHRARGRGSRRLGRLRLSPSRWVRARAAP